MKETVNFYDFCNRFVAYGREDSFSCTGKKALFEYLEEVEEDCEIEIELDIVSLCCEYTEDSIQNIADNYGIEGDREDILDTLRDNTQVIEIDEDNIIIQDY